MTTSSLRTRLNDLAESFASGVLAAIRGASLDDLVTESRGARARPSRVGRAGRGGAESPIRSSRRHAGRLPRRSADDIARVLAAVVSLVKTKGAMRSEQIRDALRLDRRELPRILHQGLASRVLRSKGEKRATTYFVGTGGAPAAGSRAMQSTKRSKRVSKKRK